MTNLVVLSEERERQAAEDKESLVAGLKKLLEAAENGELKGLCYATVNQGDTLSFGILHTAACGVHGTRRRIATAQLPAPQSYRSVGDGRRVLDTRCGTDLGRRVPRLWS